MERMVYKGFESTPKHSAEDGMFYGTVDDVDAVVMYDSETEAGLETAFMEAVDDYIDACRESSQRGEEIRVKDTCPYCEAGMIETDEAFSLDGPNGPITMGNACYSFGWFDLRVSCVACLIWIIAV